MFLPSPYNSSPPPSSSSIPETWPSYTYSRPLSSLSDTGLAIFLRINLASLILVTVPPPTSLFLVHGRLVRLRITSVARSWGGLFL